jgi:dCMP deaminase
VENLAERPEWSEYFFGIARAVAERSPCLKNKVGAIAVNPESKRILATGYNGPAAGEPHCEKCKREGLPSGIRFIEQGEPCPAVHAEENVVAMAARHGVSIRGCVVYVAGLKYPPRLCPVCRWLLKNAGVKAVIIEKTEEVQL